MVVSILCFEQVHKKIICDTIVTCATIFFSLSFLLPTSLLLFLLSCHVCIWAELIKGCKRALHFLVVQYHCGGGVHDTCAHLFILINSFAFQNSSPCSVHGTHQLAPPCIPSSSSLQILAMSITVKLSCAFFPFHTPWCQIHRHYSVSGIDALFHVVLNFFQLL